MNTAMPRPRTRARSSLLTIIAPALAAAVWCAAASSFGWRGFVAGAALVPTALAAGLDVTTHRIPDRLVLLAASPALALVIVGSDRPCLVSSIAIGAVGMAGPLLSLHLVSPAAIGWGDVKLATVLGSALAAVDVRLGIAALALASAATLIAALVARRATLPFAPGLVGGAAALLIAVSIAAAEVPR